jgi:hypothetical protein
MKVNVAFCALGSEFIAQVSVFSDGESGSLKAVDEQNTSLFFQRAVFFNCGNLACLQNNLVAGSFSLEV